MLGLSFLGLSACADDAQPQHFSPPDFSYLTPLHLNVAAIDVQDQTAPTPDSLSARAPTPPNSALKILAQQRLVGTGTTGQGQFIIKQAYLQPTSDDAVDGAMDVQLNVTDANNQHTGYVHARVTRHFTSTDQSASSPAALDTLTKQMTQDMNVELEYQIRHRLADWLTDAEGNLLTGGIQQQSLTAPGSSAQPPAPSTTTAPATPSATPTTMPIQNTSAPTPTSKTAAPSDTPDAIFPTGQESSVPPTPSTHSPKAGVLKLPTTNATHAQ
ncbi:hypothetical protein KB213_09565 [Neokomagataea sp. TBRC 2177]|uniref:Lipoprotein n=2 Tax=Neokomagataea anthophila TaxID=2826925 RepID=A0ABS5E8R4_9PROT|nr:hypothetical protein [Neokomagataea anthophila]